MQLAVGWMYRKSGAVRFNDKHRMHTTLGGGTLEESSSELVEESMIGSIFPCVQTTQDPCHVVATCSHRDKMQTCVDMQN